MPQPKKKKKKVFHIMLACTLATSYVIHDFSSYLGTCFGIVSNPHASRASHNNHTPLLILYWFLCSSGPLVLNPLDLSGCFLTIGGSTWSQFVFIHWSSPGMGYTFALYAFFYISTVYQTSTYSRGFALSLKIAQIACAHGIFVGV